jgi:methyl-accepting chemotaxis protein
MKPLRLVDRVWLPTVVAGAALTLLGAASMIRTQVAQAEASDALQAQQALLEATMRWESTTRAQIARAEGFGGDPARAGSTERGRSDRRLADELTVELMRLAPATERPLVDATAREQAAWRVATGVAADRRAEALLAAHERLVARQRDAAAELRASIGRDRQQSTLSVVAAMAAVAALLIGLSWRLARRVREPLQAVRAQADRIGTGDLRTEWPSERRDEVGELQRSLARMRDALQSLVDEVRGSAEGVRRAVSDIEGLHEAADERAERAIAQVGVAARAMGELTDGARTTTDASREANRLAGDAAAVAARSGGVVLRAMDTMASIQSDAGRIADVVGVIDGIAFQTNLLALNAAVEAAKAGEAGRGFALVAADVRGLAARTAAAARDIKALISGRVAAIAEGGRQVDEAGRAVAETMDAVQRVADLLRDIQAATDRLLHRLEAVHGAVADVQALTAEDEASLLGRRQAVSELSAQATRLTHAVARFRTGPAAAAAPVLEEVMQGPLPRDAVRVPPPAPADRAGPPAHPPGQAPSDRWLSALGAANAPTPPQPPRVRIEPEPARDWVEEAEERRRRALAPRAVNRHVDETGDDGWRAA